MNSMKSIAEKVSVVFIVSLLIMSGCDDSNPVSTSVGTVQSLYTPESNTSVTLQPNGSQSFEWAAAKAEDGGLVMYEVAFDSVGDDFSEPVYRVASDNNGIENIATLSHKTLNKAAAQAGIEAQGTGTLEWTIISSRGVNEKIADARRSIQITRLAGFANPPTNLFLTGGGTEAGSSVSDAIPLKTTGDGQFEIYTRMTTEGSFSFVNTTSGSSRTFVVDSGTLRESQESAPTIDQDGVYRINLDFTSGSATMARVENLELFSAPHNEYLFDLEYQGNSVFLADDEPYSFFQASYGPDSRYKFRMTLSSGSEEYYEWIGNDEADVGRPDDSSPDSYFYLYPVPESAGSYDYTFKFNIDYDQSIIDVFVYLQTDIENYTHEVVKVGDQ